MNLARDLNDLPAVVPASLWLRPLGLVVRPMGGRQALPLAGSNLAFNMIELLARTPGGDVVTSIAPPAGLRAWAALRGDATVQRIEHQLAVLGAPRPAWAGLPLDRLLIMGVVNVTPDSMSDGGDFLAPDRAIAHGLALKEAGADVLDIGGESTRPGAAPVAEDEEIRRILPVIQALAAEGAVISVDTRHARVMAAALAAGARIINDVTALTGDPDSMTVAADSQAPLVLMHMQGEPQTMQRHPSYALASLDIADYLALRIDRCLAAGIPREHIVIDPGIGFGKSFEHNLEIMARLALFHALGCGVLLGLSRKSLIGRLSDGAPPKDRLPGSLAGALYGLSQGVQILRVHDVAATRHAVATWQAMANGA